MDVSLVPEVGSHFAQGLRTAGIDTAEALASAEDLAALAAASGIAQDRLESFRDAARAYLERILSDAGVMDPAAFAEADMGTIAAQTGIDAGYLERYQTSAREYITSTLEREGLADPAVMASAEDLAGVAERTGIPIGALQRYQEAARSVVASAPAEPAPEPEPTPSPDGFVLGARSEPESQPEPEPGEAQPDRVVLVDGAPLARVRINGVTFAGVSLVTAGPQDPDEGVLARAGGNAVLLKPEADAVPVMVGGVTHAAVPLYKEKRVDDRIEEVRVRVKEIREVREKKGMLGRFFGKKP